MQVYLILSLLNLACGQISAQMLSILKPPLFPLPCPPERPPPANISSGIPTSHPSLIPSYPAPPVNDTSPTVIEEDSAAPSYAVLTSNSSYSSGDPVSSTPTGYPTQIPTYTASLAGVETNKTQDTDDSLSYVSETRNKANQQHGGGAMFIPDNAAAIFMLVLIGLVLGFFAALALIMTFKGKPSHRAHIINVADEEDLIPKPSLSERFLPKGSVTETSDRADMLGSIKASRYYRASNEARISQDDGAGGNKQPLLSV
jgi:hypothetical protein